MLTHNSLHEDIDWHVTHVRIHSHLSAFQSSELLLSRMTINMSYALIAAEGD